jgi:hypothetical protein
MPIFNRYDKQQLQIMLHILESQYFAKEYPDEKKFQRHSARTIQPLLQVLLRRDKSIKAGALSSPQGLAGIASFEVIQQCLNGRRGAEE